MSCVRSAQPECMTSTVYSHCKDQWTGNGVGAHTRCKHGKPLIVCPTNKKEIYISTLNEKHDRGEKKESMEPQLATSPDVTVHLFCEVQFYFSFTAKSVKTTNICKILLQYY